MKKNISVNHLGIILSIGICLTPCIGKNENRNSSSHPENKVNPETEKSILIEKINTIEKDVGTLIEVLRSKDEEIKLKDEEIKSNNNIMTVQRIELKILKGILRSKPDDNAVIKDLRGQIKCLEECTEELRDKIRKPDNSKHEMIKSLLSTLHTYSDTIKYKDKELERLRSEIIELSKITGKSLYSQVRTVNLPINRRYNQKNPVRSRSASHKILEEKFHSQNSNEKDIKFKNEKEAFKEKIINFNTNKIITEEELKSIFNEIF